MIHILLTIVLILWGEPSVPKNYNDVLAEYMQKLDVTNYATYDYVIVYPLNENYMLDNVWIDAFYNTEQLFDEILMVVVIREPKEIMALNERALSRNNLVVDSLLHFDHSEIFHPAGQIYRKVEAKNYERVIIDIFSSYSNWTTIFRRFKK